MPRSGKESRKARKYRERSQKAAPAPAETRIARRKKHYPDWYDKILEDQQSGIRPLKIEMEPHAIESAQRRFRTALERKSAETIRSYKSAAKHFGKYLGMHNAKPSEMISRLIVLSRIEAETLVEEYIKWMDVEEELSPSTINMYLAALKFFVRTARRVGWCEWQLDVDGVKNSVVKDVEGISPDELITILEFIGKGNDKHVLRMRAIIYMLAFMGLRISSILTLDMEHIDFEKGGAYFKLKGQGGKRTFKSIPPMTMEALEEWIEYRGDHDGPLMVNFTNGNRIHRQAIDKKLKALGQKLEIERPLHAHSFRHFVATEGLELTDGNRHKVMRLTEHSSDKMLERYDDKRKDEGGLLSRQLEAKFLLGEEPEEDEEEELMDDDGVEVLSAASIDEEGDEPDKIETGFLPLDLALDGGIVPGQVIAVAGAPGLGKSTMLQQGGAGLARGAGKVLYDSGEQGTKDVLGTLRRLEIRARRFLIMSESNVDVVIAKAKKLGVVALIVDSINCMTAGGSAGKAGGTAQMKACTDALIEAAKEEGMTVFIVCHVTKDNDIAGPRAVEHLVDTVLHFEGEQNLPNREIRASKNRFGSIMERGYMKMTGAGLVHYEPPSQRSRRKSYQE